MGIISCKLSVKLRAVLDDFLIGQFCDHVQILRILVSNIVFLKKDTLNLC